MQVQGTPRLSLVHFPSWALPRAGYPRIPLRPPCVLQELSGQAPGPPPIGRPRMPVFYCVPPHAISGGAAPEPLSAPAAPETGGRTLRGHRCPAATDLTAGRSSLDAIDDGEQLQDGRANCDKHGGHSGDRGRRTHDESRREPRPPEGGTDLGTRAAGGAYMHRVSRQPTRDRKSTRLNSSHSQISHA